MTGDEAMERSDEMLAADPAPEQSAEGGPRRPAVTDDPYDWTADPGAVEDFGGPEHIPVREMGTRLRAMFDALPGQRDGAR